jgi:hypothetical protein
LQPQNFPGTFDAISAPRLASYRTFFNPGSDAELYGAYCWNDAVAGAMFRLIAMVEVTIRNSFHRELSRHFKATSTHGTPISNDWYDRMQLSSKGRDSVRSITHRRTKAGPIARVPVPSPDDVVSRLTYGFWRHLLDVTTDVHGAPIPWGRILTGILPNYPNSQVSYWRKQRHQDKFFARCDLIGDMRNRIAHLEPVTCH